ncbi:glutamine--fructose-6-phosphate transaminase (isomerizing) [Candidatus Micrarchaeota archaeon]|nr:glutamine--fructose-6-phosphate transaminase (isomerizing) [Candidatus Micrarchaeota archaeon]
MCGIIGLLKLSQGGAPMGALLHEGLKKLEYRGYDSCGIAVLGPGGAISVLKGVGKVGEVNSKLHFDSIDGIAAVAHSRWATHGGVTKQNAHPHLDCTGRLALVHNGIIENFHELREVLALKGHSFSSQTDTEVLSHLIEEELKSGGPTLEALRRALLRIEGSYAIAFLNSSDGPVIYAARKYCPLAVASSPNAMVVASDPAAIIPYSREMAFLNDGEIAVVKGGGYEIFGVEAGKKLPVNVEEIKWAAEDSTKKGFEHFMIKEIHDQPLAVQNALDQDDAELKAFANDLLNAKKVMIPACGTARHAGLIARYAISRLTGKYFDSIIASEYAYFADSEGEGTVLLAISQSGETADLLECVRKVKARGGRVLSIVNVPGSTLARESHRALYVNAGQEIAVASTKAFLCQSAVGILLAYAMAGKLEEGRKSLSQLPALVEKTIEGTEEKCRNLSRRIAASRHAYCIARGINYAIAIEGALKIKEVSYVHAEGMPAGELKHGTLALIEKDTPVIAINPNDYTHAETLNNAIETKARGAYLIGVGDSNNAAYDFHLQIPTPQDELFYPVLSAIPMQLLAYYTGVRKGLDVDKPRNLAKSVTVK